MNCDMCINITKYPVGFIDGTELSLGLGFVGGISIRVPFHDQGFVGFADI